MASAFFEIDPGTGAFVSPGTAADVAPGDTVTLRLIETAGIVRIRWRCFGTHGVDPALAQAALDAGRGGSPDGETVTFTVPTGAGQAYGIECVVNGGRAAQGRVDASLRATSAVYVLNDAGRRPVFLNESFEGDRNFGVIPRMNAMLNLEVP